MEVVSATLARTSGSATVTSVDADPAVRRRLAEMGIRPGAALRVLYRTTGGGRVVSVGGARVAIDSQLAQAVTLEPTDD